MNFKIIIYLFHLILVFPYLFYLGKELKYSNNEKYKTHSQVLIGTAIMGFSYQTYLLIDLLLLYRKYI